MSNSNEQFVFDDTRRIEERFVLPDSGVIGDVPLPELQNAQKPVVQPQAYFVLNGKTGDYEVINTLHGEGGQAQVFVCKALNDDQKQGGYVVKLYDMKMIKVGKLNDVLTKLENGNNPCVTKVIEHGIWNWNGQDYYYVIMPQYSKLDYSRYEYATHKNDPHYEKRMYDLIRNLNNGLNFLHSNSIFHGDIKPKNIMWNPQARCAVLIDFGGSVSTDADGNSMLPTANTSSYLPSEAAKVLVLNEWVDYFSLGVSILELMNGAHPLDKAAVRKRVGEIEEVSYCAYPKSLPEHFKNLFCGLLYESGIEEQRLQNRWTSGDVNIWLKLIKKGKYEDAAEYKNVRGGVGLGGVRQAEPVSSQEDDYPFPSGQKLYLRIGKGTRVKPLPCESLNQVAEVLLTNWNAGIDVMLQTDEEEQFDPRIMGNVLYGVIEEVREAMMNVNDGNGETLDAEYFKFLYNYISDKKTFHWPDLPMVNSKETFAIKLKQVLDKASSTGTNFGKWWDRVWESKRIESTKRAEFTIMAEILGNEVFSTYLEAAEEEDSRIIAQCRNVEALFVKRKEEYTIPDMCEMYKLVYLILENTTKSYKTEHGTVYRSYGDLKEEITNCLADKSNPDRVFTVWNSVTQGAYYKPDFFAWLSVHDPEHAKNIQHQA